MNPNVSIREMEGTPFREELNVNTLILKYDRLPNLSGKIQIPILSPLQGF
jgi:hypothetical protein